MKYQLVNCITGCLFVHLYSVSLLQAATNVNLCPQSLAILQWDSISACLTNDDMSKWLKAKLGNFDKSLRETILKIFISESFFKSNQIKYPHKKYDVFKLKQTNNQTCLKTEFSSLTEKSLVRNFQVWVESIAQ